MRIAFLLGAGTSIPAGMPPTCKITEAVLSGRDWNGRRVVRHTDSSYYFSEDDDNTSGPCGDYVPRVREFLEILKVYIDRFFHKHFRRHETNYEDLYYLVCQINDSAKHEYENPGLEPLIQELLIHNKVKKILGSEWSFGLLHMETRRYIEDTVCDLLSTVPGDLSSLQAIGDAAIDEYVDHLDLYSLNHDLLLENYLESVRVPFCHGFTKRRGDVLHWEPGSLASSKEKVRLMKLHGSVDWYGFPASSPRWRSEAVGVVSNGDAWHTKNEHGIMQYPESGAQSIALMGTFNKIFSYNMTLFQDLHYIFYRDTREVDQLVICGYSFGDKMINSYLLDWVYSSDTRSAIIIDPYLGKTLRHARGAIRSSWKQIAKSGKIKWIVHGIEMVSWAELKSIFEV